MPFRGIRDATSLRRQVSECFERAALPMTPPEVRDGHCAAHACLRLCPAVHFLNSPQMMHINSRWGFMAAGVSGRLWPSAHGSVRWCVSQERKKLLSFVIVGGGPTGVEVAVSCLGWVSASPPPCMVWMLQRAPLSARSDRGAALLAGRAARYDQRRPPEDLSRADYKREDSHHRAAGAHMSGHSPCGCGAPSPLHPLLQSAPHLLCCVKAA